MGIAIISGTVSADISVQLNLYVHEESPSGPVIEGVLITGTDGSGSSISGTTDSFGLIVFAGAPGTWSFTASKTGYESVSWTNSILNTQRRDAFLLKLPSQQTPVAAFTASPMSGPAPLTVYCTDQSTGNPTAWFWDFDDGSPGNLEQNPSHTYTSPGTYNVRLAVANSAGGTVSEKQIVVTASPVTPIAAFTASPMSGPAPLTVYFADQSTGNPTGWLWDFGDGSPASLEQNPSHTYTSPGTYNVRLAVANSAGGTVSEKQIVVTDQNDDWENWTQVTENAPWSARYGHCSVLMPDGSIVLMAGWTKDGWKNDVWRSIDNGATWTQITANAPWSSRPYSNCVAITDGSIVLIGGGGGSSGLNDVWWSTDNGATWTQMTPNAGWSARHHQSSVALPDGSIVMMGGTSNTILWNDVWRSTDNGATWTQMTANAPWEARSQHASVALSDGSIVLMGGGAISGWKNDVWRSTDKGATWTLVNANADWSLSQRFSCVALPDDSIVIMGGSDISGIYINDVWLSTDLGITWKQVNENPGWTPRAFHSSVALPDGNIILMGGYDCVPDYVYSYKNDVWQLFQSEPSPSLLPPPVIISPGDPASPGPVIDTLTPQFKWTGVSGADEYGLYIRNLDTDTLVFDNRRDGYTLTGNSFTLPTGILQPETHYRWNMNSHNNSGWNDDLVSGYSQKLYFTTLTGTQPDTGPIITKGLTLSPGPYKVGDTITTTYTIRNNGSAAITFSNLTVGGRYDLDSGGEGTLPDGMLPDFTHRSITLQPGESYDYQGEITFRYGGKYHFFCAYSPYSGDPSGWNCNVPLASPGINREVDIDVKIPVILIHGWTGSPETWDRLDTRLVVEGYPVIIFNYEDINKEDPREVAQRLNLLIENYKLNSNYEGKFDIVCHSMGGLVSRYYIEHLDGEENIRQWIGIAPATHGSAAADAFDWPLGPINWILNSFWLGEARDQLRTNSDTVTNLKNDVSNDEIKYNVIVGVNSNKNPTFSHPLLVGTPGNNPTFKSIYNSDTPVMFEMNGNRQHYMTYIGDGLVAVEQSKLYGAGLYYFEGLHHSELPKDTLVISRIIQYLDNPDYMDYTISPNIEYNLYSDGIQGTEGILFDANKINHPLSNQIQSHEWDFGDGTKSYNAVTLHKFKKPGIYPVKLTITDQFGTKYTDTKTINIDEKNFFNIFGNYISRPMIGRTKCPVNITITDSLGRKLNATVNEIPNSTFIQTDLYNEGEMGELFIILPPLDNYYNISVDAKPNAVIDDSYSLDCVITNEFGDYKPIFFIENVSVNLDGTDDFNVEIPELLKAEFQFSSSQITVHTIVTFSDISTGNITSRLWSFGDGTTAENLTEVIHSYSQSGNYTVTLTVSGPDGEDSASQIIQVLPSPIYIDISTSVISGLAPLEVPFTGHTTEEVSYWRWDFGDGTTSNLESPSHIYSLTPHRFREYIES